MTQDRQAIAPWYKQPWLWFILTPLFAAITVSLAFVYVAYTTFDGEVKDDYFKVARGLAVDPSRTEEAIHLGLDADLLIDELTGDVVATVRGQLPAKLDTLQLEIVHPTHEKYDQLVLLHRLSGSDRFNGSLQAKINTGKRYLVLQPADKSWDLRAVANPPYTPLRIELKPVKR